MRLDEIIKQRPEPERIRANKGRVVPVERIVEIGQPTAPARFEIEIFNFLFTNRNELGIKSISRFRCLMIDGCVEFDNGTRLGVEIKSRMNWAEACKAVWQFTNYSKKHFLVGGVITGGSYFLRNSTAGGKKAFPRTWRKVGAIGTTTGIAKLRVYT